MAEKKYGYQLAFFRDALPVGVVDRTTKQAAQAAAHEGYPAPPSAPHSKVIYERLASGQGEPDAWTVCQPWEDWSRLTCRVWWYA